MKEEKAIISINKIFNKTYFTFNELKCKCGCNTFKGDLEFLKKMLKFRVIYNTAYTPRSVYRCRKHPDWSSNHDGYAQDVPYQKGNSNQRFKIIQSALKTGFKRIGISVDFVHLDTNPKYNETALQEVLWIYKDFNKQGKIKGGKTWR